MWIAIKPFRYRGVAYKAGDQVPAEKWTNRRALVITRKIREAHDPEDAATPSTSSIPVNPSSMKRAELNEYATSLGIAGAEGYTNRDLLLEKVKEVLAPAPELTTTTTTTAAPVLAEEDEDDDDVDPFADLNGDEIE